MTKKFNDDLLGKRIKLMVFSCEICMERPGPVEFVRGKPVVVGKSEKFTILGNIQPVSGNDLLQMPEADRRSHHKYIYTRDRVEMNDIATINGKQWETQEIEEWGPYLQVRVVLKDVNQEGRGGRRLENRRFNR
jgi:hypothetical protein